MIKVGLLGYGTVNSGVYEGINETLEYLEKLIGEIVLFEKILVRNKENYSCMQASPLLTDSPDDFFSHQFDVVFEAMGGEQPALDYVTFLLTKKIPVITANKELVAKHGPLLENLAQKNQTFIGYEATVAGGIPIVNLLQSQLQWSSIEKVSGILNGTTNYMITRLEEGSRTFERVLEDAQALGFAEADPTADIEGYDAMYKLQILCKLCFGTWVKEGQIKRVGMSHLKSWHFKAAEALGYRLKFIAEAYYSGNQIQGLISPCFVDEKHPLAAIKDENNGIYLQGKWLGNILTAGPGAGKRPTATSMIEDYLHHRQKSKNAMQTQKRVDFIQNEEKKFILFYQSKDEKEVYQQLKSVRHTIEKLIPIDNNEKQALLLIVDQGDCQQFDEIRLVNTFPVMSAPEKKTKDDALEMNFHSAENESIKIRY